MIQVQAGGRGSLRTLLTLLSLPILLSGCFGGGEIKDSGPSRPLDMSHVPDAVPRHEVRTSAGNKSPYQVFGKTYRLLASSQGYREEGGASWYGRKFHGRRTANGEVYDMYGMTAAHKTLPIPSYVRVTNLRNGRQVVVRVNDRGPFHGDRIIDLSYAAASKLGFAEQGTASVRVETVGPGDQLVAESARPVSAPVPSTPVSKTAAATGEGVVGTEGYRLPRNTYLQAGAFASLQGAEAVKSRLTALTPVPVQIFEAAGDALYRVRIGPVRDNQLLIQLRELLLAQGLPGAHVVYP